MIRPVDLGVPRYLVAATLRGVLSQRLVQKICTGCRGAGCAACAQTGRKGRQVVSELLVLDDAMADLVSKGGLRSALEAAAIAKGFVALRQGA